MSSIVSKQIGQVNIQHRGKHPEINEEQGLLLTRDAFLTLYHPWRLTITFDTGFPGMPLEGLKEFDVDDFFCESEEFSLYRLDTVKLSDAEFIILLKYAWTFPKDLEIFNAVARFIGSVPPGLMITPAPKMPDPPLIQAP